ncbi:MAG TPA: hypothetical protein PLJ35_15770 [Anaerolineae bacterium]|nr:hypothetical protein [Anaerolineae bacterium]HPL29298.1 hypothetical protein [Anaerolineae bacterium]
MPLTVANSPEPQPGGETPPLRAEWLAVLMQQYGPGEYIVRLAANGRVTVKIPQAPLRFDWEPVRDAGAR